MVGIRFDESSWDGSDLFMAPDRWSVFATQQARDVILSFARSVAFEPLTQVAVPERYVTD